MPELFDLPEKNLFEAYGTWLFEDSHKTVKKIIKKCDFSAHGDKHWESSYLLMDYFSLNKPKKKTRVLDVGCGWGPAAINLAELGCEVTGLDVDGDVFTFLDAQAEINGVVVDTIEGDMDCMKKKDLAEFDIIIGSDICFWDELRDEWFKMLKRAASAGVKQLVLADPGRGPFDELGEKCEKLWPTDMRDWYSVEPKRFEGFILTVDLQG